jgi:tRNA dimethylallyltransferase
MSQQKMILVAGPTASGKSALALDLARKIRGAIINADAMQIYEGLPILTAQPSAKERQEIPHELYGVLNPAEASSAGVWLALAKDAIARAIAGGRTPILVGGTGLYFRALLGGLADIPHIPNETRAEAQRFYDEAGEEKFRAALAKLDPDSAARLAKNDRQRLIRAYEVALHTGKTLGQWHEKDSGFRIQDSGVPAETRLLLPPRDELYAACDRRFLLMIERGAAEEVKSFLKRGLNPALPAMKTIGVREIASHLNGKLTLADTIAKAQQATRNYAKRQMTWFRNQGDNVIRKFVK